MAKTCSECGSIYKIELNYCPIDGKSLIDSDPDATLIMPQGNLMPTVIDKQYSKDDILILIIDHLGKIVGDKQNFMLRYDSFDKALNLTIGTTKENFHEAANTANYNIDKEGTDFCIISKIRFFFA